MYDDSNELSIGANNDWDKNVRIIVEEGTSVQIGADCQIAVDVTIRTSDGHSIIDNKSGKRINSAMNILISNRCWLGESVKILKGAIIDSDCVIGAASIVTKGHYEGNCVYAGSPSKLIRKNIRWVTERI